jgi:hypothetical protein
MDFKNLSMNEFINSNNKLPCKVDNLSLKFQLEKWFHYISKIFFPNCHFFMISYSRYQRIYKDFALETIKKT